MVGYRQESAIYQGQMLAWGRTSKTLKERLLGKTLAPCSVKLLELEKRIKVKGKRG